MTGVYGYRRLAWLPLIALLHCGQVVEEGTPPAAPPADRESWGATIQLQEAEYRMVLRAAYVADDLQKQVARADSGVQVSFYDNEGKQLTDMRAQRLTLDHRSDRIAMAGDVRFSAGDSLEARADSAIWTGENERLRVPEAIRVVTPSGWEQGRNLQTDRGFSEWTMEEVEGEWRGSGEGGEYVAQIRAEREQSRRGEGLQVQYDSVEVRYDGASIRSRRARYDDVEGSVLFEGGVDWVDSTRSFTAEEGRVDLRQRRLLASRGVRLADAEFALAAERMEEERVGKRLKVQGRPAIFSQGERRIEATEMSYDRAGELLETSGRTRFTEGKRQLEAGRMLYARAEEQLTAEGGVRLRTPELEGVVECGQMSYDLQAERGQLEMEPRLKRETGEGGSLVLRAEVMDFILNERRLIGRGGIDLRNGDLLLNADRGDYRSGEEQLILAGGVELVQESAEEERYSRIAADSMVVQLEEGTVVQVELPRALQGRIESSAGRINWIEGNKGGLFFAQSKLSRLELEGQADVTYRDSGRDEVSRFQGERMTLHFAEGELQRVWVGGGAQLHSRLRDEEEEEKIAINQVEGEELEILFADGRITQVEMGPAIEGSYLPAEEK